MSTQSFECCSLGYKTKLQTNNAWASLATSTHVLTRRKMELCPDSLQLPLVAMCCGELFVFLPISLQNRTENQIQLISSKNRMNKLLIKCVFKSIKHTEVYLWTSVLQKKEHVFHWQGTFRSEWFPNSAGKQVILTSCNQALSLYH